MIWRLECKFSNVLLFNIPCQGIGQVEQQFQAHFSNLLLLLFVAEWENIWGEPASSLGNCANEWMGCSARVEGTDRGWHVNGVWDLKSYFGFAGAWLQLRVASASSALAKLNTGSFSPRHKTTSHRIIIAKKCADGPNCFENSHNLKRAAEEAHFGQRGSGVKRETFAKCCCSFSVFVAQQICTQSEFHKT